jgi:hypothetical protein
MATNVVKNLSAALTKAKKELQKEAKQIAGQIERIEKILQSASGRTRTGKATRRANKKRGGRRRLSAAGRARIAAAQRKRWAKVRASKAAHAGGARKRK